MPIVAYYTTGQSLYVRFDDGSNTAVNLVEGSGLKAGCYSVADAAIDSAGLAAGTFSGRIFKGTAGAQSGGDENTGLLIPEFRWDGSTEITLATQQSVDEVAEAVGEIEGGQQPPDARDLEPVQHTFQLKRSGDGTLRSTNPLYLHPGDGLGDGIRFGWNCDMPSILPAGTVIRTQDTPTLVEASADATIGAIGHGEKVAKGLVEIAADATPGTHWIKTQIVNSNGGGPVTVYGEFVIQAEPE